MSCGRKKWISDWKSILNPRTMERNPPEEIAEVMKQMDAVIAPTLKSISHTDARRDACESGVRVATLPGITKEIWNQSLQADYSRVKELSDRLYELLEDVRKVRIETPSGTDLELEIDREYFHRDTGFIQEAGDFGNLPAGETDGGVLNADGILVIDHFPFAPEGTKVEIRDGKAVAVEHPERESASDLSGAFEDKECARQVAELGIGTNPKATLIGNVLQDEKVFGTVHVAFGDNSSYLPDSHEKNNQCDIHWDTVCESPTLWFGDEKILDDGEPVFLDE
jgi:leucyl aminopeptidase (aminopeptidase T)